MKPTLPEKCPFLVLKPLNEQKYRKAMIMSYFLADCTYQAAHEACTELQLSGKDLRFETKKRFNNFFSDFIKATKSAGMITEDVHTTMGENQQTSFYEDTEELYELLCLIYDKTANNPENRVRIKALVNNLISSK